MGIDLYDVGLGVGSQEEGTSHCALHACIARLHIVFYCLTTLAFNATGMQLWHAHTLWQAGRQT